MWMGASRFRTPRSLSCVAHFHHCYRENQPFASWPHPLAKPTHCPLRHKNPSLCAQADKLINRNAQNLKLPRKQTRQKAEGGQLEKRFSATIMARKKGDHRGKNLTSPKKAKIKRPGKSRSCWSHELDNSVCITYCQPTNRFISQAISW
jgi:hypothetical protein